MLEIFPFKNRGQGECLAVYKNGIKTPEMENSQQEDNHGPNDTMSNRTKRTSERNEDTGETKSAAFSDLDSTTR